ncbi:MAG: cyclic nucleotide-binding domain-containing protein [Pseudomonadota bacterium]
MIPSDHTMADKVRALIPVNGLEPWLQDEVLNQGELVEFKKRGIVFKEGDDDPYTLFLIDGELSLQSGDRTPSELFAGSGDALRAVAQLRPRRYTARCTTDVTMFRIRRAVLDHILSDEQVSKEGHLPGAEGIEPSNDDGDWMSRLIESELFTRLPPDHMQRFFFELEPIAVTAGQTVVEQGTRGDYLYIVAEGECAVLRRSRGASHEQELARLGIGAVFGEEALISEAPRNATVRALQGGMLMRLPKSAFEELISKPVLKPVPLSDAEDLVAAGAQWLDVRFPEEFAAQSLPDAINIPLHLLRLELKKLDRNRTYVTYCDTGGRASTAAFLMTRDRFEVQYLAGGLNHTPLNAEPFEAAVIDLELAATAPEASAEGPSAPGDQPGADTLPEQPAPEIDQAHAAELGALTDQIQFALRQLEDERLAHETAVATLSEEMQALRGDRDMHAGRANRAVHTARELKARVDQSETALATGNAQLNRVKVALTAASADAERRLDMERTRFTQELESLNLRAASDRARLEQTLADAEQAHTETVSALHDELNTAENRFSQTDSEHRIELSRLEESADVANAKVVILEAEIAAANSRIAVLESRFEVTRKTIMVQESELQEATREAAARPQQDEAELESIRTELFTARAEFDNERRQFALESETRQTELDTEFEQLRSERQKLETARVQLEADRSTALADVDAERERRLQQLDQRSGELAALEASLKANEATWEQQVADAVTAERERLDLELSSVTQARTALEHEQTAGREELAAQVQALEHEQNEFAATRSEFEQSSSEERARLAAQSAELDTREQALADERVALQRDADTRSEDWDQKLASARNTALRQLAALKADYERKLAEQAALLAEERRRLENQTVRLNEALTATEHAFQPGGAKLVEDAPAVVVQAPVQLPDQNERARVMSPAQLAELRKSMQSKMESLKK